MDDEVVDEVHDETEVHETEQTLEEIDEMVLQILSRELQ